MKFIKFKLISSLLIFAGYVNPAFAQSSDKIAALITSPCTSGYNLLLVQQAPEHEWDICISDTLTSTDAVDEASIGECLMKEEVDYTQAWNPEAASCLTLTSDSGGVFVVTREHASKRVRVDIAKNYSKAGCFEGSGQSFLIAPNATYCLKDIGEAQEGEWALTDITDGYFSRELPDVCGDNDESEERLSSVITEKKLVMPVRENISSNTQQMNPSLGSGPGSLTSETGCPVINVSKMTGLRF